MLDQMHLHESVNRPRKLLCVLTVILICESAWASASPSSDSHDKAYWLDRITHVHLGMKRSDVEKWLPVHSNSKEKRVSHGHSDTYAVDSEWSVQVPYDFNGYIEDERKNPYGVMHLYNNRIIGPIKLIHKHTIIDWTSYPPTP